MVTQSHGHTVVQPHNHTATLTLRHRLRKALGTSFSLDVMGTFLKHPNTSQKLWSSAALPAANSATGPKNPAAAHTKALQEDAATSNDVFVTLCVLPTRAHVVALPAARTHAGAGEGSAIARQPRPQTAIAHSCTVLLVAVTAAAAPSPEPEPRAGSCRARLHTVSLFGTPLG